MRFFSMGDFAVGKRVSNQESFRTWLSGLAITLTTIVAYFAFWHLAPVTTFLIGCSALIGLIVLSWYYGRSSRKRREKETEPQRQTAPGA